MQVAYGDVLQVWREADAIPQIEHAWLFDHLMPIGGDPAGPAFEGWTLLSALAAQTERLRVGLLVTSNRFRPPAMLAKIAATVDVVSDGRLDFGIGAGLAAEPPARPPRVRGARPAVPRLRPLRRQPRRGVHGDPAAVDRGRAVRLTTAVRPAHRRVLQPQARPAPSPPIVIGGRSTATLRVVAEHADVWNIPGGDLEDAKQRSALPRPLCAEIGRDPAEITRSIHLPVAYDDASATRHAIAEAVDAGFTHVILGLSPPYPQQVAAGPPRS
jgi:alkanesulfonate monooxygenase SsuD/methylene tetrahydromethanopterin reductase-like flavin-dependent oxidoreductase (luciferase family)